jgi:hypothetical protein
MPDDFKIKENITAQEVMVLLDKYWGLNKDSAAAAWSAHKCTTPAKLPKDLARICAFLSQKDKVKKYLRELETELNLGLNLMSINEKSFLTGKLDGSKGQADDASFRFKTHKLLSGVMDSFDHRSGFNNAGDVLRKLA